MASSRPYPRMFAPVTHTVLWLAAMAIVASSAGCSPGPATVTDGRTQAPLDLPAVEIREYQGKNLGSVTDFRENSILGPQTVDLASYSLEVTGLVETPLRLSYNEVTALPAYRKAVTLNCVEGWSVDILWEGVRISDLLRQAGYDRDGEIVIFRCYDGYTTSLPLEFIVSGDILLAYRMNGIDLPVERGFPFQVVAEDRWGYKWAKWVTAIEVNDDTAFRGYWESRGYDDDASLPSLGE